jgi:hypothetical protein
VRAYAGVLAIEHDQYQRAVVLYKRTADDDQAITRIEVLSPGNIESRVEAAAYDKKRTETLTAGINLIEVHYLHRSPPPTGLRAYIPNYAVDKREERQSGATAYFISMTEPLGIEELDDAPGTYTVPLNIKVYPFGVEDPIPTIAVPLAEDDSPVHLAMQAMYDTHFFEQRWGIGVYYDQTPEHVDSYSQTDQLLINARSLTVVAAYRRGVNLETGQKLDIDFDALDSLAKEVRGIDPSTPAGPSGPAL